MYNIALKKYTSSEINNQMYSNIVSFKTTRKLFVQITKINACIMPSNIILLYI